MAVFLQRSQIPTERVKRVVDFRIQAFVQLKGRNPTPEERAFMVNEVVSLAKKIDQDRGVQ